MASLYSSAERGLTAALGSTRSRFGRSKSCVVPSMFTDATAKEHKEVTDRYWMDKQHSHQNTLREAYSSPMYLLMNPFLRKNRGSVSRAVADWENSDDDTKLTWWATMYNNIPGVIWGKTGNPNWDEAKHGFDDPDNPEQLPIRGDEVAAVKSKYYNKYQKKSGLWVPTPMDVIAEFQKMFQPLKRKEPLSLYRVFGDDVDDMLEKGNEYVDHAYVSTAYGRKYYEPGSDGEYGLGAFRSGEKAARAKILVPPGTRLAPGNRDEDEFIISRGARYTVLDVQKSTNSHFGKDVTLAVTGFEDEEDYDDRFGFDMEIIKPKYNTRFEDVDNYSWGTEQPLEQPAAYRPDFLSLNGYHRGRDIEKKWDDWYRDPTALEELESYLEDE